MHQGRATRTADADALKSRGAGGLLYRVLRRPLFQRLEPESEQFRWAASLLRSSRDPLDNRLRVVAVSAVQQQLRRALYQCAKAELGQRRGADGVNETLAFHGTSLLAIDGICRHGFALRHRNAKQFGFGLYLSPAGASDSPGGRTMMAINPMYSSKDAQGVQHLLLCRVLCGNPEQVRDGGSKGSDQFQPSEPSYDSGVDLLLPPPSAATRTAAMPPKDADCAAVFAYRISQANRLIMWSGTINSHVLPTHVVSVRVVAPGEDPGIDGEDPAARIPRKKARCTPSLSSLLEVTDGAFTH